MSTHSGLSYCLKIYIYLSIYFIKVHITYTDIFIDPQVDMHLYYFCTILKSLFIYLQRGEGREKKRETHWCERESSIGCQGQACNPGRCPNWESNMWLFALGEDAQSTEPHRPVRDFFVMTHKVFHNGITTVWASSCSSHSFQILEVELVSHEARALYKLPKSFAFQKVFGHL